jgi:hypothetical protein
MWEQFVGIVRANRNIPEPGPMSGWIANLHAESLAIGIRRQTDYREQAVSLVVLRKDMIQHPEVMTRERYFQLSMDRGASLDDPVEVAMTNSTFDKYAGSCGAYVDPLVIEQDVQRLSTVSAKVRSYVNRRIAHRTQTDVAIPTFGELNAAIDELDGGLRRYHLLLTGATLYSTTPTMQYYPWTALTVPWVRQP